MGEKLLWAPGQPDESERTQEFFVPGAGGVYRSVPESELWAYRGDAMTVAGSGSAEETTIQGE